MVQSVLREYRLHSCDVVLREDCTIDQFIDVVEGNRKYMPALYVMNKIDQVRKRQMASKLTFFVVVARLYSPAVILLASFYFAGDPWSQGSIPFVPRLLPSIVIASGFSTSTELPLFIECWGTEKALSCLLCQPTDTHARFKAAHKCAIFVLLKTMQQGKGALSWTIFIVVSKHGDRILSCDIDTIMYNSTKSTLGPHL